MRNRIKVAKRELEYTMVIAALMLTGGNMYRAAELLGVYRRDLYKIVSRRGIDWRPKLTRARDWRSALIGRLKP